MLGRNEDDRRFARRLIRWPLVPSLVRNIQKTVLPNGLRVVTEYMPTVRSIAVGVWVNSGSRHEAEPETGITHFTEHMVFKGTENFSAQDIAISIDSLGGHLDAFTSKETTAFTAKVLDEHLPQALDMLADMVQRPTFVEDDIEREKGVVLEELKMDEDNPDYLIGEVFAGSFWSGHGLGRPIIGNARSIKAYSQPQLRGFFERTFRPTNLLITAAGNAEHDTVVEQVRQRFKNPAAEAAVKHEQMPQPVAEIILRDKPSLEQVHMNLGVETFSIQDSKRYAGYVLSTLLGGGFSSRLFQKIREQAGLAYTVYADLGLYSDTGCLSVYAGTSLDSLSRVIDYTLHEFRDLKENLVPDQEIRRAKDQLKGGMMLSLESTGSRMTNLARQETHHGRVRSLDEINDEIEAVTKAEIQDLANEWFHQERLALAVLGNLQGLSIDRESLAC